jgi:hypothetical protein
MDRWFGSHFAGPGVRGLCLFVNQVLALLEGIWEGKDGAWRGEEPLRGVVLTDPSATARLQRASGRGDRVVVKNIPNDPVILRRFLGVGEDIIVEVQSCSVVFDIWTHDRR